jgi:hypothetical protein
MSKASSIAYLIFAILTSLLTVVGGLFLLASLTSRPTQDLNDAEGPYTSYFFVLYSLANATLLVGLGIAAIRLFKRLPSGWSLLTWILKVELVSALWLLPEPWGMSAAGATGIGNMGISPQFFIAYPITGVLAIWMLRKCHVLTVEPTPA